MSHLKLVKPLQRFPPITNVKRDDYSFCEYCCHTMPTEDFEPFIVDSLTGTEKRYKVDICKICRFNFYSDGE